MLTARKLSDLQDTVKLVDAGVVIAPGQAASGCYSGLNVFVCTDARFVLS